MKLKTIIFLILSLLILSCNEEEETLGISEIETDITTPDTQPGTPAPNEDENIEEPTEETPLVYKFDHLTGKCQDDMNQEGFNLGHLGECGDLSGQIVADSPLNKKNYFGLLLKGSKLVETKISFHKLAKSEVKVDNDTEFPDKINAPHTSLFLGHTNAYRGFKKSENKYYEKYLELRTKFKTLKREYKAIARDNQKAKQKKMKQIEKVKKLMTAHIKSKKIQKNKSKRQKKYIKGSYKLAKTEDRFINQRVKNKKFLTLDGSSSFMFKASNKVFPSNKTFTVSLWFKTDMDQQDKRLINFHRGTNPGSALNLSLKSSKIVLGIHDGNKYHSVETDYEYDSGDWHHFLVTKKKNKFIVYLNGVKVNEYQGDFSNFGDFPAQLGSYNGSGYFYTGDLDEVSLWQSHFSKSDVQRLYNEGTPSNIYYHRKVTSLLHWWRLGDHKKDSETNLVDIVAKEVMNRN